LDWNLQLTPMQLAGLLHVNTAALGLPHQWMTAPVSQRSGGEQQRIAIALTTAQAPALCFLDEPLTHLDEVQQVQCLTQLKATGKALVMVSHHIRLSLLHTPCCRLATALGWQVKWPVFAKPLQWRSPTEFLNMKPSVC
jgi:energy-coupling factor transporter ATP-binding protein EcfA2